MKIIYFCFGRAHSSVVAAYLHLGKLPLDRLPAKAEIEQIPEFDKATKQNRGIPYYVGADELGNEVYILGFGSQHLLGLQTVYFTLNGRANLREWKFFNTLPTINWTTRIGGFLSRTLGLVSLGRPIVIRGIRGSYWKLVALVQQVKELVACQPEK